MSAPRKQPKPPHGRNRSAADDDDPVPADIVEFRLELARRIATFVQAWRTCRRPPCRRARRCAARRACANIAPRRPLSPEHDAALMAKIRRLVQRRLAEIEQHKATGPDERSGIRGQGRRA